MNVAQAIPKLPLCENLTIDFAQLASAHHTVGVIWRIATLVILIATTIFSTSIFFISLKELSINFEVITLLSSLLTLTLLALYSLWHSGTDEFAQCRFYQRVAEKERNIQCDWHEHEIKAFFAAHDIEFSKNDQLKRLLQTRVKEEEHFSKAFIPAIAHYKILRAELTCAVCPISAMQRCLDQLNLAMILQSLHRPCENRWMKLDNRFTDTIPGIGRIDRLAVVKLLSNRKNGPAFIFNKNMRKEVITIMGLLNLEPDEIRSMIFD